MSPQRKKVVVLCAAVAAISGLPSLLTKTHPRIALAIAAAIVVLTVYAVVEFVKWKRSEG